MTLELVYFEFVIWAALAAIAATLCGRSLWRDFMAGRASTLLIALTVLWIEQALERSWWLAWRTLPRHGIDSSWMPTHPIVLLFPILASFAALAHVHAASRHNWPVTLVVLGLVTVGSGALYLLIR